MKIKVWRQDLKLRYPWAVAGRGGSLGKTLAEQVFIRLEDPDSLYGWGEGAPPVRYQETAGTIQDFLSRIDGSKLVFGDLEASARYLDSLALGNQAAKAAVNLALLDGAARSHRQTAHAFCGLGFDENRYLTCYSIGIDTPERIRQKVADAQDYPVLKIKLGGPDDSATLAAVREVARAKPVRVDANESWKTPAEALKKIEWLATDGRIEFVEQPMPSQASPRDLQWLKERSPLPVFADESYHREEDLSLCRDCFHGVNVKLVKTGGLLAARQALIAARAAGLQTMLGCMIESSLLISAAGHLAALTDYLDLDGNLLITNDPFLGLSCTNGLLSLQGAPEAYGLQVAPRPGFFSTPRLAS